jgi:basic amino acid/polyamine antiporter, APA family
MTKREPPAGQSGLVATLGRWDLTTLVVNTVIGGGIFGLPVVVAVLLGASSLLGYVAAAAGIGVIVLCFAEVSTQFRAPGGPYLYAREAFGPFAGLQVGWITWLMRIAAVGANTNLFVTYLATVWPAAGQGATRFAIITLLIAAPAAINIRGIKQGATANNLFVAAKIVPLIVFVAVGLFFLHPSDFHSWIPSGEGHWFRAILLLVYAFGGFDNAVIPASETRDPARDAPFGLLTGMGMVTVLYLLIQLVFQATTSAAGGAEQTLATAARNFLGSTGVWLIAAGAMMSIWGWLIAIILGTPRLTYALGAHGDFPRFFSVVHPRFRTPYVSILIYAGLGWALAVWGNFEWNASLSAVARLLTYGATCAAVPVFRRRALQMKAFRIPGGYLAPALGVVFCLVLLTQMGRVEFIVLATTIMLAALTWTWSRKRAAA